MRRLLPIWWMLVALAFPVPLAAQIVITPARYPSTFPIGHTLRTQMAVASNLAATPSQLGTDLAAGTYTITVTALDVGGGQTDDPAAITCVVAAGGAGRCAVSWDAVPGAVSYRVWTSLVDVATPTRYFATTQISYNLDTLTGATVATLPTSNSAYVVSLSPTGASWISAGSLSLSSAAALGTTSTDGLVLANTTAATAAVPVQISQRLRQSGTGWDTNDLVSRTISFFPEVLPVSGTTVTGTWKLGFIDPAEAITYPLTVSSGGVVTALSDFKAASGGQFQFSGRSRIHSPADAQLKFTDTAEAIGVGFDFGTDGLLKGRNRAQTAYATTDWGNYRATAATIATGGNADTAEKLVRSIASIADATPTDVLTVTIPNAAHTARIKVRLLGSLGAGGAVGANEASGEISYDFVVTRTAGVNAVVTASAAYGSATAAVAGATTITITAAASAVAGAVGAVNTFTVQVTITKGGGASTNHTCRVEAEILNANASGITMSE